MLKNSCKRNYRHLKLSMSDEQRRGRSGEGENLLYTCALGKQSGNSSGYPETPHDPAIPLLRYTNSRKMNTYRHRTLYIRAALFIVTSRMDKLSVHQLTNEQNVYIYQHNGTLSGHHKELCTERRDEIAWMNLVRPSGQVKEPVTKDPTLSYRVSHLNLNHLCARWVRW